MFPHKSSKKNHTKMKEQAEQLFCAVRNYSPFLRALSSRISSLNKICIVQCRDISFSYTDTLFICILHAPVDTITYIVHSETEVDNLSPFGVKCLVQCYVFGG